MQGYKHRVLNKFGFAVEPSGTIDIELNTILIGGQYDAEIRIPGSRSKTIPPTTDDDILAEENRNLSSKQGNIFPALLRAKHLLSLRNAKYSSTTTNSRDE